MEHEKVMFGITFIKHVFDGFLVLAGFKNLWRQEPKGVKRKLIYVFRQLLKFFFPH